MNFPESYTHPALWPPFEIAFTADGGIAGANQTAVASLIANHEPEVDLVVFGGDNYYGETGGDAGYATSFAAYNDFIAAGKVVAALGNHDLDVGFDQLDFLPPPSNQRYFSHRLHSLELFVMDSGLNTAGALVEPDGNDTISVQAENIRRWLGLSTAHWKGIVIHHAPYSSGSHYPGVTATRWIADLPVDFFLLGHDHLYERLEISGKPHFVVGTGGRSLYAAHDPVSPYSQALVDDAYGALFISGTAEQLVFRFQNTAGLNLDRHVITKTPYAASRY